MIRGLRAAARGMGMALRSRELWRSYLLIVAVIVALSLGLDLLGIWGLRRLTVHPVEAGWLVRAALGLARILGTLAVLLLAPLVAIFTVNILVPVFNEIPFLAGLRKLDPERAAALEANEGLRAVESVVHSLLRLAVLLSFQLLAFGLSFVPVVGVVLGPAVGLTLGARQVGWELLDPYFARRGLKLDAQRAIVRAHRAEIIAFGLPFTLLFAVPLLGPLSFAWAQAAAARLVVDVIEAPAPPAV